MAVAATFAATLVDEWIRCGVTDAVIAPGSRSAPLALALAADNRMHLHVFIDERSAGFFALGLGLAGGRPAVVLTTSGTAAVELHPAVVEAAAARVPLIACTADRPPDLHGVGAPQTIDQSRLYGTALRWFADPGVPAHSAASSWRPLAGRAVAEANGRSGPPGPVQLNLAFRDPLVGEPGPLPPGRPDGGPWNDARRPAAPSLPAEELRQLGRRLAGRRGVIVAGAGAGPPGPVHLLAEALGWPVLADPCSGSRVPRPATVAAFDALLRHAGFAGEMRPEAVLRLGAPPASRVLAAWLSSAEADQVAAWPSGSWYDPEGVVGVVVRCGPEELCRDLAAVVPETAGPDWLSAWAQGERAAQAAFDEVLDGYPEPTEPGVARTVAAVLPAGADLFVSSSMPVRDVEWYGQPRHELRVLANRGANGIDGIVATALGVAAAGDRPVAAVLGDLAFLHDSSSLLGARSRGVCAALVVVDNNGGGIFSFLPQAQLVQRERFETLFGTPHDIDLAALARAHGLAVTEIAAAGDLAPALQSALAADQVRVLVALTNRDVNVTVHEALHAAVAAALDGSGRVGATGAGWRPAGAGA